MTYADKLEKLADEAEQGCGCSEAFHKLRCAYVEAKDDLGMAGYSKPSQARKVAALVRALKGCNNVITSHLMADGVLPPSAREAYQAGCKALADIEGEGE